MRRENLNEEGEHEEVGSDQLLICAEDGELKEADACLESNSGLDVGSESTRGTSQRAVLDATENARGGDSPVRQACVGPSLGQDAQEEVDDRGSVLLSRLSLDV